MESRFDLASMDQLMVQQVYEMAELFGFETRNKYQIQTLQGVPVGYAAEQHKGFGGFIFRQLLGHWRSFDVHFFTPDRQQVLTAHHPFRWFFRRIEVRDSSGAYLGAIQKRFSLFRKRFDVLGASNQVLMEVSSPFWRIWTFPFKTRGREVATVRKKWSGILAEGFTDRDKFLVEFKDPGLDQRARTLVMAAAIFIDLLYFEKKAD